MRVIFKDTGKIEEVSDGYGRNYLIPKGLAVLATEAELEKNVENKKKEGENEERKKNELKLTAEKLGGKLITVSKKTGEDGKLFGSVTTKEISEAINSQLGFRINKHNIILKAPIKTVGEYKIIIDLGMEARCQINLKILN